jgi:hypothetical protein
MQGVWGAARSASEEREGRSRLASVYIEGGLEAVRPQSLKGSDE